MADLPPHPDTDIKPNRRPIPTTPRWVKVSGMIAITLIVLVVALHLAGYGFGGHAP